MELAAVLPLVTSVSSLLLIALLVRTRREWSRALRRAGPGQLRPAAAVAAVGLLVRLAGPFAHAVYMDEWSYLEGARTVLLTGRYELCRDGLAPRCALAGRTSFPATFPVLSAWAFSLAGVGSGQAMALSALAGAATVPCVHALSLLLLGRPQAALVAAVLMALLPLHVQLSSSAGPEAVSLLLVSLTLSASALASERPRRSTLALALLSASLAAGARHENLLALPFAVALAARRSGLRALASAPALLAALALLAPTLAHRAENTEEWSFSLEAAGYKSHYLAFWAGSTAHATPRYHTAALPLLALAGAWALWRRDRRALALLAAWFLSFLALFSAYVLSTSYRYLLTCYLPVVLLAGLGAERLAEGVGGRAGLAVGALASLSAVAPALPLGLSPGGENARLQPDVDFAAASARRLPEGCAVATFNPAVVAFEARRPALDLTLRQTVLTRVAQGWCVALLEDTFCTDPGNVIYDPSACASYREELDLEELDATTNEATGAPLRLSLLLPR